MDEPGRGTSSRDLSEWPSLELAYEFVRSSYEIIWRAMDRAEARARASLGFAGTLMIAAPAFVAATQGPGSRSFASPWFVAGAVAFIACSRAWSVADSQDRRWRRAAFEPRLLANPRWLDASTSEFRWNLLLWAADDWDSNRAIVGRMANIAMLAAGLLGLQVISLAIWVLGY